MLPFIVDSLSAGEKRGQRLHSTLGDSTLGGREQRPFRHLQKVQAHGRPREMGVLFGRERSRGQGGTRAFEQRLHAVLRTAADLGGADGVGGVCLSHRPAPVSPYKEVA